MKDIKLFSAGNAGELETIGLELAETYKVAFAGDPWFEVSRCGNDSCSFSFSGQEIGCPCPSCQSELIEAYNSEELLASWDNMLRNEDAVMEVAIIDGYPQRATIARPTTPKELFVRKYNDVPEMASWLKYALPTELVWIEDTFADRIRVQSGNLNDRGSTLDTITEFYQTLPTIATRTLAPGIVRATLRDKLGVTCVYLGEDRVGSDIVNNTFDNPGYSLPMVPDRRTLLVVGRPGRSL